MQLTKTKGGYRITVEFASREGKDDYATFFWNGSNLRVESITDLDYLENLYDDVSHKLNVMKGRLN
jgi:hypothetical protein